MKVVDFQHGSGRYAIVSVRRVVVGLGNGVERTKYEGDGKMVIGVLEGSRSRGRRE
jgi:hypothetical protein